MTTANNSQINSIESLFIDLTPEEAQNISGGGWGKFWKGVKKIGKKAVTHPATKTIAEIILFGRPL